MNQKDSPHDVLRMYGEILQNAEGILSITEEMTRALEQKDTDALNRALVRKQKKIDRIRERTVFPEGTDQFAGPEAEKISVMESRVEETYGRIYDLEKSNLRMAQDLMEEFRDAIQGIQKNQKVMRAYAGERPEGQSILLNRVK